VNHLRYFREKRIVSLEAHRDDARSIHRVEPRARARSTTRARRRARTFICAGGIVSRRRRAPRVAVCRLERAVSCVFFAFPVSRKRAR